jgi:Pyridoxamine 5'-phosphate oxidase
VVRGTIPGMARWVEFEKDAPEFAARVRAVLDRHKHKTMATLRGDGSPRISGAEIQFAGDDVFTGSMPDAVKGRDLRRDPRVAFHSQSEDSDENDPESWPGDAKFAGRAVLVSDPAEIAAFWAAYAGPEPPDQDSSDLFRIEVEEVVLTWIDPPETMVIESWHEGVGYRRRTRT